jgi:hypothetical protein
MTQILLWQVFGLRGCYPTAMASHRMAVPEFALARFRSSFTAARQLRIFTGFPFKQVKRQRAADYKEQVTGCIAGFDISLTKNGGSLQSPPSHFAYF